MAEAGTPAENFRSTVVYLNKQSSLDSGSLFTGNFELGDRSSDVLLLQQFLNLDSDTVVALSGAGSAGRETESYGPATKRAVIHFQEKYASEVLVPSGLSRGNGRVGPNTKARINLLAKQLFSSEKPSEIKANPAQAPRTKSPTAVSPGPATNETVGSTGAEAFLSGVTEPLIAYVSPYDGHPESRVTITAGGLTESLNVVHFGDEAVSDTKISGASLTFSVPNLPFGKYDIFITNSLGTSNKSFFVITDPKSSPPFILSTSPESCLYGEEVTIRGANFTPTGNEIYSSYGSIKDVASPDGTTLVFKVLPFPEVPELQAGVDLKQNLQLPVEFYVVNRNGISRSSGSLVLRI